MEGQAVKYKDYIPQSTQSIPYGNPSTQEEMSKAKKVANELNFFLSGISIFMIVVFIISLFNAEENYVKVLICVMMIIVLGITLMSMSKKLQVFTGIAVYKQIIRRDIHSKKVY